MSQTYLIFFFSHGINWLLCFWWTFTIRGLMSFSSSSGTIDVIWSIYQSELDRETCKSIILLLPRVRGLRIETSTSGLFACLGRQVVPVLSSDTIFIVPLIPSSLYVRDNFGWFSYYLGKKTCCNIQMLKEQWPVHWIDKLKTTDLFHCIHRDARPHFCPESLSTRLQGQYPHSWFNFKPFLKQILEASFLSSFQLSAKFWNSRVLTRFST